MSNQMNELTPKEAKAVVENAPAFIKDALCTRQISQNPYPIRILPS